MNEWVWSNGGMLLTGENWTVMGEKLYTAWVADGWMSMEQWWNGTDRGNWSTGRKTLYSVGGRWMNEYGAMVNDTDRGNWSNGRKTLYSVGGRWMIEYGAMVEWYWQGKTEVLGEKLYTACVVDGWMSMEQWWNDTDRGTLNCTARRTLYRVGGRWMNEYGAMVECYWQGKTEL